MPDTNITTITVDDVITAWGDQYLSHQQNMDNLHMLPFEAFGTQDAGTLIETNDTIIREANVEVQEVLQQYQDDFTAKGGTEFTPVEIKLYNMKIDVAFIPQKLRSTWLGFLTNNDKTPEDYPFVVWAINNYVLKQKDEDLENAIYKAVYVAPTSGTAGQVLQVMNGIEKQQNDLVAAGDVDIIDTGDLDAMTPTAFVTAIEEFIKEIPEKYRYNYQLDLNMNRTFRDKFRQGMQDKYNVNYQMTEQLLRVMHFENVMIKGRASMIGKERIWTTPKFNLLMPVKGFSNRNGFDVQKFDRKVKFLTDFWAGVGFVQPQLLFMNGAEVPESSS